MTTVPELHKQTLARKGAAHHRATAQHSPATALPWQDQQIGAGVSRCPADFDTWADTSMGGDGSYFPEFGSATAPVLLPPLIAKRNGDSCKMPVGTGVLPPVASPAERTGQRSFDGNPQVPDCSIYDTAARGVSGALSWVGPRGPIGPAGPRGPRGATGAAGTCAEVNGGSL